MGPAEVAERKRKAKVSLEFATKIYLSQVEHRVRFPREHPLTATSWGEGCVKLLVKKPGAPWGVGRMC
eukprot:230452-Alexandrium_andersonii.AAC.1